jgi:hypothetical protein
MVVAPMVILTPMLSPTLVQRCRCARGHPHRCRVSKTGHTTRNPFPGSDGDLRGGFRLQGRRTFATNHGHRTAGLLAPGRRRSPGRLRFVRGTWGQTAVWCAAMRRKDRQVTDTAAVFAIIDSADACCLGIATTEPLAGARECREASRWNVRPFEPQRSEPPPNGSLSKERRMKTILDCPHRLLLVCAVLLSSACASRQPPETMGPSTVHATRPMSAQRVPAPPPPDSYRACTGKELGDSCVTILEDQATEGHCVNPPPGATEPGLVCSAPQASTLPSRQEHSRPSQDGWLQAGHAQGAQVQ